MYFEDGNYVQAYAIYSQLVSLYGSNPLYSFRFGASGIYATTDREKSIFFMKDGIRRGYVEPETHYFLARAYHLNYNFKEALFEYEKFEASAEKKELSKSDCKAQKLSAESGLNLMNSIKDVQVLEKTEAEKSGFYRYMNIDPSIGKIISTPKELLSKLDLKPKEEHVLFLPANGKRIFFSSKGKDGLSGKDIYMTSRSNGTFATPTKLKSSVNTEFDEDFAFMHPNGSTLYFASKGHGSMGGYDIFRCEWDETISDFGPAINLDFAINTPDDDLFFITDSLNTTAYFASSRLTSPDKLYVYRVFVNGIPMNITYLKGEFISRVNATDTEAKIQVFDDLTNRKIMDTQARESNGQYLLFIPSAGNYTYRIQPPGSPQIHEVNVKIPASDNSRVFRQEIVYTRIDGREKVEINNYWDDPLNDNVEDLQRQMLIAKSQLDVNATVVMTSSTAANTSSVNSNSSGNTSSAITPTNQDIVIEEVLTSQEKTILLLKQEIATAEETSKSLLQYVQQTLTQTDEAYEEFQNLRFEKPESIADSAKLTEARSKMIGTQDQSVAAISAYEISKAREKELLEKLKSVQSSNNQIKESLLKKDSLSIELNVSDYVAKNPGSEQGKVTQTETSWKSENAKEKVNSIRAQRDDTQLKITIKSKEIEEIEAKADKLSSQMSVTKKKKEIEQLGNELIALRSESTSNKEEIETEKINLDTQQLALQEASTLLKLLIDLEQEKQPEIKPEFKNLTNTVNVESLKAEITESKYRVSTALENSKFENPISTNNSENSNNTTSNNVSSNNTSSKNTNSNNTSPSDTSSNNASSNNTGSNNISNNNTSNNNTSNNNTSNNSTSNNSTSTRNNSSNNATSNKTFTTAEISVINSPGQSNYKDENIFEELKEESVEITNREVIQKLYTSIEIINRQIKEEMSSERIAELTKQRNQLMYEKMQEEEKNSLVIAQHNSTLFIDLQSSWKKNTTIPVSIATLSDKKAYDNAVANMKEANTLRTEAKKEPDFFERYAKNARAFALERNAKNELQFLVDKTTPSANNVASNNTNSDNTSSNNANSNNASSNNANSNNTSSNNTSSNNTNSNNTSSNNTSSTTIPKIIQATLYQKQTTSAYSDTNPIPIGLPLPEGSFYTIQVGAFRIPVANNTFSQFAPVYAERQSNGFIRYSTGFFSSYTEAIKIRNEIRQMGYADAFIVAYKNRERVRYSELMTAAERASNIGNSAPANSAVPSTAVDLTYYSDPLAVPAKLIEKTEGVFFTVQIGVYAKPSRNNVLTTYSDLHAEKLTNGQIRYTSGEFQNIADVLKQRDSVRANGIPDAFVTAYKNGKRITVPEAKKELGIQ